MPKIKTHDGTKLYYRDWGTGAPIVLIHGWPLDGEMWEKQATFLAEHGLRVIYYDRRGYGRSDQPWSGYDYDTFAADLNSVMETLDLRAATLVGFSMGGGEVVRYLSRYGDARVAKAVLISAVTPFLLKTPDNPEGIDQEVFQGIADSIRQDRTEFLQGFAQKFYGRSVLNHTVSEAVLDWYFAMGMTATLRATLAAAQAWSSTDFRAEMQRITVPVRIIHGTADVTVPLETSGRRSLALLPNATLSEYDGEPHGLFLTAADRLNEELLDFIGETRNPVGEPAAAAVDFHQ